MKNKFIIFIAVLLLILGLASCKKEDVPEGPTNENEKENVDDSNNMVGIQGDIKLLESAGHLESAYVEWEPLANVTKYNAYYKPKGQADDAYVQIDSMLIRQYEDCYRVDMLGLSAGEYEVKIVPVLDGVEDEGYTTANVTVSSHDRSGYAFQNGNDYGSKVVPGAYNLDGTLKDNARVLYVSQKNFESISLEVHTSSSKTETKIGLQNILSAYEKGYESQPLSIRLIGKIDVSGLTLSGENSTLQVKSKGANNLNITIEGVGEDSTLYGWGLLLYKANSVEVRNIGTMLFKDDGISLKTCKNIWVHNCDIFYGGTGGDADQAKGDGSLDLKDDSQNITISYVHFWDSGKMSLCGMKSETGENWITYHHNWFDHSDSRHPRVRTMSVHVYNNFYDGVSKYGVGATTGSSVFVESNYFYNTKTPMMSSLQGTDALGDGTFSGEAGGMIKSYANVMYNDNPDISTRYITYNDNNQSFDAYEVESREEKIPSNVVTVSGSNTYNNFDTEDTFYEYKIESAEGARETVKKYSGRINGGDFTWDFSDMSEDQNYEVDLELKNALTNYKSKLVKIMGSTNSDDNDELGSDESESKVLSIISEEIEFTFVNGIESEYFDITGNMQSKATTITYDNNNYSHALKMETATSISFKISKAMTLVLVTDSVTNKNIKVNKVNYKSVDGVYSLELAAGEYTITKGDSMNLYLIVLK